MRTSPSHSARRAASASTRRRPRGRRPRAARRRSRRPCAATSRRRRDRRTRPSGQRCRSSRTAALVRAEVPGALLPAHGRRVERREGARPTARRRVGSRSSASTKPVALVELDRRVGDGGERGSRLARSPAHPPADVGLGRRAERSEPAAEELRLRRGGIHLVELRTQPGSAVDPAVLAVDPRPRGRPRTSAPSAARSGRMRDAALTSASQRVPARGGASSRGSGSSRERSDVNASPRASSARRAARRDLVDPAAGSLRDAARGHEALEPRRSRAATVAGAGRVDDGHEVARHDPERASHAEHADERAVLVELLLEVVDVEAARSRPDREEHRRRVARVERRHRAAASSGSGARARREAMTEAEPRPPLLDVDPLHAAPSTSARGAVA